MQGKQRNFTAVLPFALIHSIPSTNMQQRCSGTGGACPNIGIAGIPPAIRATGRKHKNWRPELNKEIVERMMLGSIACNSLQLYASQADNSTNNEPYRGKYHQRSIFYQRLYRFHILPWQPTPPHPLSLLSSLSTPCSCSYKAASYSEAAWEWLAAPGIWKVPMSAWQWFTTLMARLVKIVAFGKDYCLQLM